MTGWIIYSTEDVEKNKYYIQMYQEKFKKYGTSLKLVIADSEEADKIGCDRFENYEYPDFAINRSRNADIAERLESVGVKVFNNSRVTRIANDKGKTYEYLKDTVPFMPVRYAGKTVVSRIADNGFEYPYVIKSCDGHGGSEVFMIENRQQEKDAVELINSKENCLDNQSRYVVQQCCSDLGKDVRVYIIGNKIIKAVLRTSTESFKSNYSLGGSVEEYKLNDKEKAMVHAIVQKLPLDYAGIDFTFHKGEAVFNEIEDAVGARMLYQVSDIDIVQEYVDYLIKALG